MRRRLSRNFFRQSTIKVSKQLLGKFLVRKIKGKELVSKIVETEAYIGPNDKASHASLGKIKRCQPMYGKPGIAYVYFIYGMYWMLNIVTEKRGRPCAVLVRALEPLGAEVAHLSRIASGPGKLCQWMEIDGSFSGEDLIKNERLWLENRGVKIKRSQIVAAKRIGVDYAGKWKDKKWRFYINDNPYVSKR